MENPRAISLRERIRLNLVAAMENAGINQVQLADKLNISKGTVNNWTRGNNSPDVDMVPRICDVLGISVLSIYSPTEFESPETPATKKSPAPSEDDEGALTKEELSRISAAMSQLNEEGRERVVEYAEDLAAGGRFKKPCSAELGKKEA